MSNIEVIVPSTSIFLLGIIYMMFLLTKTRTNTFCDIFSLFTKQVKNKCQYFGKICWGLGGWLGVDCGLSEKWFWRKAYICHACMIYIIGKRNLFSNNMWGQILQKITKLFKIRDSFPLLPTFWLFWRNQAVSLLIFLQCLLRFWNLNWRNYCTSLRKISVRFFCVIFVKVKKKRTLIFRKLFCLSDLY